MSLWRYLFRRRRRLSHVPLLSLRPSSETCPYPDPGRQIDRTVYLLKGAGIVRTRQDAIRCLMRYPGKPISYAIRQEKRKRHFHNRFILAWRRLWRRW